MYTKPDAMDIQSMSWRARYRRSLAALVALVVFIASVPVVAQAAVSAGSNDVRVAAVAENAKTKAPKPCQKSVIPGTVNTCLSSFSISAIPAAGPEHPLRATSQGAPWRMSNSLLPAQCGGFSPYRPPCLNA
jgi:hypothetical protein